MFSTVRYFIKTSVIFLIVGIFTGLYMSISKYILPQSYSLELISAHSHLILVGSVMMMIMGVALWFFPCPDKDDKKYNPNLILFIYWFMTIGTSFRFIFQVTANFIYADWIHFLIAVCTIIQVIAISLFFYSMWGRIRPLGSHIREAKGEKF